MPHDTDYNEIHIGSSYNNAILAGGVEVITDTITAREQFAPFNSLLLTNRSDVAIKISLDGLDAETGGRITELARQTFLQIEPEEGKRFSWLKYENLDSTATAANDTIHARWARAVRRVEDG